jgi:ubiquitin C-terminal hydrolase
MSVFGLNNLGNTCYLNALIQSLLSCSKFCNTIRNINNNVAQSFIKIIETNNTSDFIISLQEISKSIKNDNFNFNNQQDSHEIYEKYFIGPLCEKYDVIKDLFKAYNLYSIYCFKCHTWNNDQKTYKIINENWVNEICCDRSLNSGLSKNLLTLLDKDIPKDINDYIKKRFTLLEDYTCEKCKDKNIKKIKVNFLVEIPPILVLYFNKIINIYNSNDSNDSKSAIYKTTTMDIKLKYDLYFEDTSHNVLHYELQSILLHSGSQNGGHYTAYGKRGDKWFYFDDNRYVLIEDIIKNIYSSNEKNNIYMVFYQLTT